MTSDKKAGILLGCGLLSLLLGAMPLNGYVLFLLWPNEFHHDPSTGTVPYLYLWLTVGLILWLNGAVLITLGATKAWLVLVIGLVGIGGGVLISVPSFSNSGDHKAAIGFVAVSAAGVMLAAAIRAALNACRPLWKA